MGGFHKMSILLVLILSYRVNAFGQQQKENIRWFEMRGTQIREMSSKITGQDYELIINLPYSYAKDTTKRYPVVYFCDGFYDFALLSMIYADQIFDQTIRECFLVGFSYKGKDLDYGKLRTNDYTPTRIQQYVGTGGGPKFLEVVEKEFIPFMEKNYRVDSSFRALGGSSLGGLFVLYTMFTRTDLFNAYIAVSPAVLWDQGWLINTEGQFHARRADLPVSLYMTGAEKEFSNDPTFIEGIKFFGEVLKKRNY